MLGCHTVEDHTLFPLSLLFLLLASINTIKWVSLKAEQSLKHAMLMVVDVDKSGYLPTSSYHFKNQLHHTPQSTLSRSLSPPHHLPTPTHQHLIEGYKKQRKSMQEIHTSESTCSLTLSSGMSTKGFSNTHRRNDSGELDVFEAAQYFSGGVDGVSLGGGVGFQRAIREERTGWRAQRKSLDIPMQAMLPQEPPRVENLIREKKSKQPSSPGGRLASFLNSFLQAASKKKSKSFSSTTHSLKVGEEGERRGGRRRKSSITHSRNIRSSDSKSIYSSESSAFETPPPYANTQRKLQHEKSSCSKFNGQPKLAALCPPGEVWDEKRVIDDPWLAEKAKPSTECPDDGRVLRGGRLKGIGFVEEDGFAESRWVLNKNGDEFFEKDALGDEGNKEEDGGESDSSSDLFELKNYDLADLSSGLPVYGTTDMEITKRGSAIPSVAF